ncbi:MAG TPA: DPP IV N-terminal domain-containing protein, partial [Chitinophagaceae bacterium]|nr:DPP IV N-terminal domain-containing protein [Chitinophagaceae bacterium]
MAYRFKTLLIFLFVTSAAFSQKKFEVNDLVKLVGISDPQISPDAKTIAIVVSRADTVSNTYKTELSLVDIATGIVRPLTFDRQGLTQPRWSPDGSLISFVARTTAGSNQLFALNMLGGEAKQITNAPNGVQHYAWSPDGANIAYVTSDDVPGKEMVKKGYDAFEIRNNDMFLSAARQPAHIWLIPATGGEAKRLTSGSWSLPVTIPPGPPSSPLSWSADSRQIVFVKVISSYSGDNMYRSTQILNVADGSIKPLTTRDQMEGYPTFSQDGSKLTYWYTREGTRGNINDIWVTPA